MKELKDYTSKELKAELEDRNEVLYQMIGIDEFTEELQRFNSFNHRNVIMTREDKVDAMGDIFKSWDNSIALEAISEYLEFIH